MIKPRKLIAAAAALVIAVSASGCRAMLSAAKTEIEKYPDPVNTPISADVKWINSSIDGAIDETLETSLKDDFYTYVLKDWLLETEVTDDDQTKSTADYYDSQSILNNRKLMILKGETDPEANEEVTIGVDEADIELCKNIVERYYKEFNDYDSHTDDMIKPYIDHICSISTMDELSAYISDADGMNTAKTNFLNVSLFPGIIDEQYNRVGVMPPSNFALSSGANYINMTTADKVTVLNNKKFIKKVLTGIGYSEEQAVKVANDYFLFDSMLATNASTVIRPNGAEELKALKKVYSLEDMSALCGAYPFKEVAKDIGIDNVELHTNAPGYLSYLGSIYNINNLELIKSYLIADTIMNDYLFLSVDTISNYHAASNGEPYFESDYVVENKRDFLSETMTSVLASKIATPFVDTIYLSYYCTPEMKQQISEIIDKIIDYYHTMINEEDWISLGAKEKIIEKLDNIIIRSVYPDTFPDFSQITISEDDSLIEMTHKLRSFNKRYKVSNADVLSKDGSWIMEGHLSPTEFNSTYSPDENSINIYAGYLAGSYNAEDTLEERLAVIGITIGHEITHAFDANGMTYDKNGMMGNLVDLDDMAQFELKADKVSSYYNNVKLYPSGEPKLLYGSDVKSEAIADMGGIKSVLGLAKNIDGFDYDLFFRTFAKKFAFKSTFKIADYYYNTDVHPLDYLRVNVGLNQFDEFISTYGLQPGDGMYLAPENRINVW